MTVPAKPAVKPSQQQRQVLLGLEGMLQENLRLGAEHRAGQQGLAAGWGDPSPSGMDCSREFLPAAASQPLSRSQSCVGESGGGPGLVRGGVQLVEAALQGLLAPRHSQARGRAAGPCKIRIY